MCRTKAIIKDQLPNKYDEVVFCPLTEEQVEVYKRILGTEAVQNMIRKDEKCDCRSGKKYGKGRSASVHLLNAWIPGGRIVATLLSREIFSSICLR